MKSMQHRAGTFERSPHPRLAVTALAAVAMASVGLTPTFAGASSSHASKELVISAAKSKSDGTVLVSRTTLYTLKPSATACAAACWKIWPEVLLPKGATKATAGIGVSASKLGTIKRAGGLLQVTYGGKPLYRFFKDKSVGQVNGDLSDTWGKWSAVVTVKPSSGGSPTTTTTSPGGGGVGF
jgi:predicted lipoprotein with Yx(FWY)xxD motif